MCSHLHPVHEVRALWFCITCTKLRLWFKSLAPLSQPIKSKAKTNRVSRARVFPRFESTTCTCFKFWLVQLIVCFPCDWKEYKLLWLWFYDTQLKAALISLIKLLLQTTYHADNSYASITYCLGTRPTLYPWGLNKEPIHQSECGFS